MCIRDRVKIWREVSGIRDAEFQRSIVHGARHQRKAEWRLVGRKLMQLDLADPRHVCEPCEHERNDGAIRQRRDYALRQQELSKNSGVSLRGHDQRAPADQLR